MIPLKDNTPRSSTPVVTVALIIANTLAFLYELTLPERLEQAFFMSYAMVPTRFTHLLAAHHVAVEAAFLPFLTSMFLHGGWLHLIGNMWFLWVFGDNVEDRLGHFSYLIFYLVCGFGAGLAHVVMNLHSSAPSLGASGAISGVLGAYIVLYPRAKILTLVPLIIFWFTVNLPAYFILGYWFVIQFFSGVSSVGARSPGGVAYWAHIGGFLMGVWLVRIWPQRRRTEYSLESN
ncbi:MAG TPA: rhomboid family intramembrane serine protease [Candidatus Acidoferrales bacterium]|nr:rhomboid family intramembrane serine protease [Candidatus Acidoferrales bacterium]